MATSLDAGDMACAAKAPSPPPAAAQPDNAAGRHRPPHHPGNTTVYQTVGPDAHSGPILAPGSAQPALNPRSCVTCRRRKVRCDKQMPCSNCRRALVPCVFPAPGRAPRQQRPKDPNAPPKNSSQREVELIKRLRKLEGIVEELSSQVEAESAGKAPSSAGSPDRSQDGRRRTSGSIDLLTTGSPLSKDIDLSRDHNGEAAARRELQRNFGRMVLDDHRGTSRYVSSSFWSKLNDEVRLAPTPQRPADRLAQLESIREETQKLTDDDADESEYEPTPTESPATGLPSASDHHAFALGYRSADVALTDLHPLPSQATYLWSAYQENVEPLIKILHVPTTDLMLRNARQAGEKLTPGNEALVFAIYYAAITSLEPEEVWRAAPLPYLTLTLHRPRSTPTLAPQKTASSPSTDSPWSRRWPRPTSSTRRSSSSSKHLSSCSSSSGGTTRAASAGP